MSNYTLSQYQADSRQVAIYPVDVTVVYPALGVAGEAGEIANKIKKYLRGDFELTASRKQDLAKEIGDVLWYCAALAYDLGFDLGEIAEENISRLLDRKARDVLHGDGDDR